jgi:hypothetical protein
VRAAARRGRVRGALGFRTTRSSSWPATKKCSANQLSLVNRDAEGGHGVAREVCRREQQEGDHDAAGRVGPRLRRVRQLRQPVAEASEAAVRG